MVVFLNCYGRQATNNIVKYNLRTERVEKQISLPGSCSEEHLLPVGSGLHSS